MNVYYNDSLLVVCCSSIFVGFIDQFVLLRFYWSIKKVR